MSAISSFKSLAEDAIATLDESFRGRVYPVLLPPGADRERINIVYARAGGDGPFTALNGRVSEDVVELTWEVIAVHYPDAVALDKVIRDEILQRSGAVAPGGALSGAEDAFDEPTLQVDGQVLYTVGRSATLRDTDW